MEKYFAYIENVLNKDNDKNHLLLAIAIVNMCGVLTMREFEEKIGEFLPSFTLAEFNLIVERMKKDYNDQKTMYPYFFEYENEKYVCSCLVVANIDDVVLNNKKPEINFDLFNFVRGGQKLFGLVNGKSITEDDISNYITPIVIYPSPFEKKFVHLVKKITKERDEDKLFDLFTSLRTDIVTFGPSPNVSSDFAINIYNTYGRQISDSEANKLTNIFEELAFTLRQWPLGGKTLRDLVTKNPQRVDEYFDYITNEEE